MDINTCYIFSSLFKGLKARNLKKPEEILTHNIAIWLRNEALSGFPIIFFHVPNESFTSISYALKLNSMGRIPGAPDFVVAANGRVIFLEIKAPNENGNHKLSNNQKMFREWSASSGTPYFVVDSLYDVKYIVKRHLLGITDLSILSDTQNIE